MPRVVNAVGTGALSQEVNLNHLANTSDSVSYDPESHPGAYYWAEDGNLVSIYRTGSYVIRAASVDELQDTESEFLTAMEEIGLETCGGELSVDNIVMDADLDHPVNLNAAVIELGIEYTEYEPEQFPGMFYRPEEIDCVLTLFSTGKLVVTGITDEQVGRDAVEFLREQIRGSFQRST